MGSLCGGYPVRPPGVEVGCHSLRGIPLSRYFYVKGLLNYAIVRNFLVAQEKLPGKLQARAIISIRRGWIFIAWIFIARNFLPSVCSIFIEEGCGTLSIHLLSFLKCSEHYLNSCLFCRVYKVVISIGTSKTVLNFCKLDNII